MLFQHVPQVNLMQMKKINCECGVLKCTVKGGFSLLYESDFYEYQNLT